MRKSTMHPRSISCEPLEERRLFTTLVVPGTDGPDHIVVSIQSTKIIVDVNDQGTSVLDADFDRIQIDGLRGDDVIDIINTGANMLTLNTGEGDDTIDFAPTSRDLDVIGADVTINAGDGKDLVTLNDQVNANAHNYGFISGNTLLRDTPNRKWQINDAAVTINGSVGSAQATILDMPTFDVEINSNSPSLSLMTIAGDGTDSLVYTPSGSTAKAGSINTGAHDISFTNFGFVSMSTMAQVEFISPKSNDTVGLLSTSATSGRLSGDSGFVQFAALSYFQVGVLRLDLGLHNAANSIDRIIGVGGSTGASRIDIADSTGTNTMEISGGTWSFDTGPGTDDGSAITMKLTGATTNVMFGDSQTLKRIQLDNGATVTFLDNSGAVHEIRQLAVTVGAGTFDVQSGVIVNVPAGGTNSFVVGGATRTFRKTGSGTLNINATQTHATDATFEQAAGFTNLGSDVGTSALRPMNVHVIGGVLNAGVSQHMKSLAVDGGAMTMSPNGNRVLATGALLIDTTDAMIDLADNDLHATAAPIATVRGYLASAYNFGGWDGAGGIFSSTAKNNPLGNTTLGLLTGAEFADNNGGTFNGAVPTATDALVKYTYYGDVDFNGAVDASDYNLIDFGFANHLTGWANGDADYSGGPTDVSDYNLIDFAFATQGGAL